MSGFLANASQPWRRCMNREPHRRHLRRTDFGCEAGGGGGGGATGLTSPSSFGEAIGQASRDTCVILQLIVVTGHMDAVKQTHRRH